MSPIILVTLIHAIPVQIYPNVADLTPFTQPANYMSLSGVLRLRYRQSGDSHTLRMTRAEIDKAIVAQ